MFQNNSRTESNKGIRFYEKDIIKTRRAFSTDTEISFEVDYVSAGIGVTITPVNQITGKEENRTYLYRLGSREYSLSLFSENVARQIKSGSFISDTGHRRKISFNKTGRFFSMLVDGKAIDKIEIPEVISKYRLGIYSSKNNTIKSVRIISSTPKEWSVNMMNTDGGEIEFVDNGIYVSGCNKEMQIAQEKINLPAGEYFLSYDKAENSDIDIHVALSGDERISISEKDILDGDRIKLDEPRDIDIIVRGKSGYLKNLSLSNINGEKFVIPENNSVKSPKSSIKLDMRNVETTMVISKITRKNSNYDESHYLFCGDSAEITIDDLNIESGENYTYIFKRTDTGVIAKIYSEVLTNGYDPCKNYDDLIPNASFEIELERYLGLFSNVDSVISFMSIRFEDGKVINPITEVTKKEYVSPSGNAPVTVYSENEPLDMSSSYRTREAEVWPPIFTTVIEREVFDSQRTLVLEKEISTEPDSIKLYAIKKGVKTREDNLLKYSAGGAIDEYCDNYDLYLEESLKINKDSRTIVFDRFFEYEKIIVDYLKKDSFSVNKISKDTYEVEMSFDSEEAVLTYETSPYKTKGTGIKIEDGKYVVLNKLD